MGLERFVLAALVLLTYAASVKGGNCASGFPTLNSDCSLPPPEPATPYFINFLPWIHESAESNRYDVGSPGVDFWGKPRQDYVKINEDWANGIGMLMNAVYRDLHISVVVFSDLTSADSLHDLQPDNQFDAESDAICGDKTRFDTFEADKCKLLGGAVTLNIKRGGGDLLDGEAPIDDPKLEAKCMVFFTSKKEPTFSSNDPFLLAYNRAAEEGMNRCVQKQTDATVFDISHAVAATPLLTCVRDELLATPRGIAITPLGLPTPGARPAKVGGTGFNNAIRHIYIFRYVLGPYLYLTIQLPAPVAAPPPPIFTGDEG